MCSISINASPFRAGLRLGHQLSAATCDACNQRVAQYNAAGQSQQAGLSNLVREFVWLARYGRPPSAPPETSGPGIVSPVTGDAVPPVTRPTHYFILGVKTLTVSILPSLIVHSP